MAPAVVTSDILTAKYNLFLWTPQNLARLKMSPSLDFVFFYLLILTLKFLLFSTHKCLCRRIVLGPQLVSHHP